MDGHGPCVLLLPGTGQDSHGWHRAGYVASLSDRFTTVAVDLPGLGAGTGSTDPHDYRLAPMLAVLDAVADHLGAQDYAVWG